jgi:hypothetical protein
VRQRVQSTIAGAVAGGLLGLVLTAIYGGRMALGSVDAVTINGPVARSQFVVSSGGMYALVLLVAVVGGLAIAGVTYALGRETEPDAPRFPLAWLMPVAGITSAIMAYAVLRGGLGAVADISAGVVTVSVFRFTIIALVAGIVAGAVTARLVDAVARPALFGEANEAWPESPRAFMLEMARAVGAPTIAAVVIAAFAITFSQVLLQLHGPAAVAAFSVVAALILGLVSLAAYRPWDRGSSAG